MSKLVWLASISILTLFSVAFSFKSRAPGTAAIAPVAMMKVDHKAVVFTDTECGGNTTEANWRLCTSETQTVASLSPRR